MSSLVDYGDTSSANSDEESSDTELKCERLVDRQEKIPGNKRELLAKIQTSYSQEDEPPFKKIMQESKQDEVTVDNRREMLAMPKTEKDPLILPSSIHSMFPKSTSSWVDKPAEHNFRMRSFPHVEGNWATHVFIPVPQDEKLTGLVNDVLNVFSPVKFHAMSECHISLSRTVVIRYHWIESLVDSLRQNLSHMKNCLADIISVKLLVNDEKTRTFVCLEVSSEDTFFLDYIKAVDKSFAEFKLSPYYKNPSFHISIGWCLGDIVDRIPGSTLLTAKEMLATFCATNPDLSIVFARQICCQSGNKSFLVPLGDGID